MNPLNTLWRRLRPLGQRRAVKQEIDEELRFHLEQRTKENLAAGMTPEEAAREARKRFGNVQSVREECRDARGANFGEATWMDLKFALRQLLKNPGFTVAAVLTLALGIGASSKQPFEFLNGEARVPGNFSHRECVDGIVAGNHDDPDAVAHDRVLSFADDLEPRLLQGANGRLKIDAWQFGHRPSEGDDLARDFSPKTGWQFGAHLKVFVNRVADVGQSFLARGPLAATTWEFITPDSKSLFGFDQRDRVVHGFRLNSGRGLSSR